MPALWVCKSKYHNNLIQQDHQAIKRCMGPMLGFKEFRCARIVLDRIEVMHMIAKGQMKCARGTTRQPPTEFYSLMTQAILNTPNQFALITLFATEPLCPLRGTAAIASMLSGQRQ